jgi:hypothetical protein
VPYPRLFSHARPLRALAFLNLADPSAISRHCWAARVMLIAAVEKGEIGAVSPVPTAK